MAWQFTLTYVDYDGNKSSTRHTINGGEDDGAGYNSAKSIMTAAAAAANALSLSNVYFGGLSWVGNTVLEKSNNIAAKNAIGLKVVFDLGGKSQKGRITVPGIQETLVRGSDRKVNNTLVSALDLVELYTDGDLLISDGDVALSVADADIISRRSTVTE